MKAINTLEGDADIICKRLKPSRNECLSIHNSCAMSSRAKSKAACNLLYYSCCAQH